MKLCNKVVAYDLESTSEWFFRAVLLSTAFEKGNKVEEKNVSPCFNIFSAKK